MLGFKFREKMAGTYARGDEQLPIGFDIEARAPNIFKYLVDGRTEIEGTLYAEGFGRCPLKGTLELSPTKAKLTYDFCFSSDGKDYRFEGEKRISLRNPLRSMTSLHGEIYCDEQKIAEAILNFSLADELAPFIGSFRPILTPKAQ